MLWFSRKMTPQSVFITTSDGEIELKTYSKGGRIRLGIAAPRACKIRREEVAEFPVDQLEESPEMATVGA